MLTKPVKKLNKDHSEFIKRITSPMGDQRVNQILGRLKRRCMYKGHMTKKQKQINDFSPKSQNTINSIVSSRLNNPTDSEIGKVKKPE